MSYSTFDLLEAAAYGSKEEVLAILDSGIDVNAKNAGSGETALMTAAGGGKIDTVKLLVARGAAVNATNCEGGTALLVAIDQQQDEVVEFLLANGASPNAKLSTPPGLTALCMAAQRGYLRILKALLNAGADANGRAGDGSTPLINAAFKGHTESAKILLENGADKQAMASGLTAENFAEHFGYLDTATAIRNTPQGQRRTPVSTSAGSSCLVPLIALLALTTLAFVGCGQKEPSLAEIEQGMVETFRRESGNYSDYLDAKAKRIGNGRWAVRMVGERNGVRRTLNATAVMDKNGDIHYYTE